MKKIRRGKDFKVIWSFFDCEGNKFLLSRDLLSLYIENSFDNFEVTDFSVEENKVIWIFKGKDQKILGDYTLRLVKNNNDESILIDEIDAFSLVLHSHEESSSCECGNINIEDVSINSELSVETIASLIIDTELSETSHNAVANYVITEALKNKVDKSELETLCPEEILVMPEDMWSSATTSSSINPETAIYNKIDFLTFDQYAIAHLFGSVEEFESKLSKCKYFSANGIFGSIISNDDSVGSIGYARNSAQLGGGFPVYMQMLYQKSSQKITLNFYTSKVSDKFVCDNIHPEEVFAFPVELYEVARREEVEGDGDHYVQVTDMFISKEQVESYYGCPYSEVYDKVSKAKMLSFMYGSSSFGPINSQNEPEGFFAAFSTSAGTLSIEFSFGIFKEEVDGYVFYVREWLPRLQRAIVFEELEKKVDKTYVDEVISGVSTATSVTYAELVALRDNGELVAGTQYRITDYETTTVQENTSSAGHRFDIVVLAIDTTTLSEQVLATRHVTDSYFDNSDLGAWKIWYSLDNDAERFAWADTVNGKGVIYRMIDEHGNDCPYDFKNILFGDVYTFSCNKLLGETEDVWVDNSLIGRCEFNVIRPWYNSSTRKYTLNNNTFINGESDYNIPCIGNIIEENCYNNKFGSNIVWNKIGPYSDNNTFGSNIKHNTVLSRFSNNKIGNEIHHNSFGTHCKNNTLGSFIYHCQMGNGCISNLVASYSHNIIFENGVYAVKLSAAGAREDNLLQNYTVASGLNETGSSSVSPSVKRGNNFHSRIDKSMNGDILVVSLTELREAISLRNVGAEDTDESVEEPEIPAPTPSVSNEWKCVVDRRLLEGEKKNIFTTYADGTPLQAKEVVVQMVCDTSSQKNINGYVVIQSTNNKTKSVYGAILFETNSVSAQSPRLQQVHLNASPFYMVAELYTDVKCAVASPSSQQVQGGSIPFQIYEDIVYIELDPNEALTSAAPYLKIYAR